MVKKFFYTLVFAGHNNNNGNNAAGANQAARDKITKGNSGSQSTDSILLVSCVPVKLIINASQKVLPDAKNKNRSSREGKARSSRYRSGDDEDYIKIRKRTIIDYLSSFMLLTVILAIIPHLPAINKDHQQIGACKRFLVHIRRSSIKLVESNSVNAGTNT